MRLRLFKLNQCRLCCHYNFIRIEYATEKELNHGREGGNAGSSM
jgi:hypothetical protein